MVLDGVVDPTEGFTDWLTNQTIAIDASITRAFEACTTTSNCPVDDLAATYDEVQKDVERAPIPAGDGADDGAVKGNVVLTNLGPLAFSLSLYAGRGETVGGVVVRI